MPVLTFAVAVIFNTRMFGHQGFQQFFKNLNSNLTQAY
jgi:hypothetical protein